jgi:hypothetical protein
MRSFQIRLGFVLLFLLSITAPLLADDYVSIEREVDKILQKRDIRDVAADYARTAPHNLEDWLKRLSVFGRAGHDDRVRDILSLLPSVPDRETSRFNSQISAVAKRAIERRDLRARRLYYELIDRFGDDDAIGFAQLWKEADDREGLEKWLAHRAEWNDTWFRLWVTVHREMGTAESIYQKLEDQVRADPGNWDKVKKYYEYAYNSRDLTWLAESPAADSAFGAYRLGTFLDTPDKSLAISLFQKSLRLPFTEKDRLNYASRTHNAMAPALPNDAEKQIRFQTKKSLAEAYLASGQPQLAQPIAEELASMDMSEISPDDVFRFVGGVQLASGQRAVESKILEDEGRNENSVQYWIERIHYYQGRGEKEAVWDTYMRALARIAYLPGDREVSYGRLRILEGISYLGGSDRENEIRTILRQEFAAPGREGWYLRELTVSIHDDFRNLSDEIFVNTRRAPKVMASEPKWNDRTAFFIREIMPRGSWIPAKRDAVWDQMAALARKDVLNRANILGDEMMAAGEKIKAIPLLESYVRAVPASELESSYAYDEARRNLFEAYLETGKWQKAERMYFDGFRNGYHDEWGLIAVSAAKAGSSADALRLWKINANLDRRKLEGLSALAKTPLKAALRQFYLDLKKADPLTSIPDRALAKLK